MFVEIICVRQAGSSGRCCNPVLGRKPFINDPTCKMITRRSDAHEFRETRLVTAHKRSYGNGIFSVASVCLSVDRGRVPGDFTIQGPPSPHPWPHSCTCSNLFNLGRHCTAIVNLFTDQSEVSALPAGC